MNKNEYQLFVDLDGVLVDFEAGVLQAAKKSVSDLHPREMWPILAKTSKFYENLGWMEDGKELWNALKNQSPVILTGVPMGQWAAPQKIAWCRRELGEDIPVITGLSRNKGKLALEWLEERNKTHLKPILIDDRLKIKEEWECINGRFFLHINTASSIQALRDASIL